jgi:hypothetical protein
MTLVFCEYSDKLTRQPVVIDPQRVVKLTPVTREVVRSRSFTEHVSVLTIELDDRTQVTVFDTTGQVARRIIAERARAMGRAVCEEPAR